MTCNGASHLAEPASASQSRGEASESGLSRVVAPASPRSLSSSSGCRKCGREGAASRKSNRYTHTRTQTPERRGGRRRRRRRRRRIYSQNSRSTYSLSWMTLSKLSLVTTRTPSSVSTLAREVAARQSAAKQNPTTGLMLIGISHSLFLSFFTVCRPSHSLSLFPWRTLRDETRPASRWDEDGRSGKTPPSARRTRVEWADATLRRRAVGLALALAASYAWHRPHRGDRWLAASPGHPHQRRRVRRDVLPAARDAGQVPTQILRHRRQIRTGRTVTSGFTLSWRVPRNRAQLSPRIIVQWSARACTRGQKCLLRVKLAALRACLFPSNVESSWRKKMNSECGQLHV